MNVNEKVSQIIDFIKYHAQLKRENLLFNENNDISKLILEPNKKFRLIYGDWIHYRQLYKAFYRYINGDEINES